MDDAFEKYSARHNKNALMYTQKRKTKICECGRGVIYTDSNSRYNAIVNDRQVCSECKIDSIYAGVRRNNE